MTTDQAWAAMTERERDAKVHKLLWGDKYKPPYSGLASTWPGMGLVVERMRELGFSLNLYDFGDNWEAQWIKTDSEKYMEYGDSAPSAAALAAVRALEAK